MGRVIVLILGGMTFILALWAGPLQAKHHSERVMPMKTVLFKDVELTLEQKEMIRSFRMEHRQKNPKAGPHKEDRQLQLMEDVLFDEITLEQAHQDLNKHQDRMFERHFSHAQLGLKLLSTYSPEQVDQVLENLEFVQDRASAKKSVMKKRFNVEHDGLKITQGIDLTEVEKAIAQDLKELHLKIHLDVVEQIEALSLQEYLSGEQNSEQILEDLEEHFEDRRELIHQKLDLWADLVSDFNQKEREIMLDNLENKKKHHIEELHQRHQNKAKRK